MARPKKENADYFSHDSNMRSHRKIIALRTKYGLEGYAIYCMLLEHIASCDFFTAKRDIIEQEIIAGDFGVSVEKLVECVSFCHRLDLIQLEGETLKCKSMIDRLKDLIDKRNRERNRVSVTETTQVVTESPQSKVKKSKRNNNTITPNPNGDLDIEKYKEYFLKIIPNPTPSPTESFILKQATQIPGVMYQIYKKSWEKYLQEQEELFKKIVGKIGEDGTKKMLLRISNDSFWKSQIGSVGKLLDKNKEGIPYFLVIINSAKSKKAQSNENNKNGVTDLSSLSIQGQ